MRRRRQRDPQAGHFLALSLLIMGLATPLFLWSSAPPSLNGCDESFYAQMAREILSRGAWLGPTFLGQPFFEKPPLLPWLVAGSYSLGGVNEWTARLPGILSALACIPLIGWIGKQFLAPRSAILAMIVLPLCFLWVQEGRLVGQDVPLTLIELVGIAALVAGIQGNRAWYWAAGIAFGLGLLMKSVMILLVGLALLPYMLTRRERWAMSVQFWLGLCSGLLLFFGWGVAASWRHGGVWQSLLGKVQDLGAESFHANNGWFYYLWHIPSHGYPWTVLSILGLVILIRERPGRTLLIWSLPLVLLLELEVYATRTHYYTVQLYPWLALLAGVALDSATFRWRERGMDLRQKPRLGRWISAGLAVIGFGVLGVGIAGTLGLLEVEDLASHWGALIAIGLIYTLLPPIWVWRRALQGSEVVWISLLFSASIITLISILSRPDFGNFNPSLAEFSRQQAQCAQGADCRVILPQTEAVDIGRSGIADVCQAQAYAFYTPNPGQWVGDQDLRQGNYGDYLWVSPVQQETQGAELRSLQSLTTLQGWQLMRRSAAPS